MAKDTPSMAKNKIRRCLMAILDPHPSSAEVEQLWEYFNSSCAYCGCPIDRASRAGHQDHVISSALGGNNSIHNHVLSCARCNGDEKRETAWEDFLAAKAPDSAIAAERHTKISNWIAHRRDNCALNPATKEQAEAIIAEALGSFDVAVKRVRALRDN